MIQPIPPKSPPPAMITRPLKLAISELPLRYRRRLEGLCESVDHYIHLHSEAMRTTENSMADLALENTYLRFDLDVTRRELENLRANGDS